MPRKIVKVVSFLLCFCLLFEQSGLAQVVSKLNIAVHLANLHSVVLADKSFHPLHLRYLAYDPIQNNFNLLLDKGDAFTSGTGMPVPYEETRVLLNYFFIGLTLPNSAFWVNLRPDSETQIIDEDLAKTDCGRILLEADLQLKKDTARFTSPETPEGKEYWDRLYQKAGELFGNENISIPTLTRPWIVPGEIILSESPQGAYIYKATLKVMLEEDYLNSPQSIVHSPQDYSFQDSRLKELNAYSSELLRELIIPKLTKEVNSSQRYSSLRQVYYSLILAQWFKSRFYGKGGLYSYLIDKKLLNGLTSKTPWSKTTYFQEYQKSFQQGEYNLKIPVTTPYGQSIRTYTSGGIGLGLNNEIGAAIDRGGVVSDKFHLGSLPEKSYLSGIITVEGSQDVFSPADVTIKEIQGAGITAKDIPDVHNPERIGRGGAEEGGEIIGQIKTVERDANSAASSPAHKHSSAEEVSQQMIVLLVLIEESLLNDDSQGNLLGGDEIKVLGRIYHAMIRKGKEAPLSQLESKLDSRWWRVRLEAVRVLGRIYQTMIKEGKEISPSQLERLEKSKSEFEGDVARALDRVRKEQAKKRITPEGSFNYRNWIVAVRRAAEWMLGLYQALVRKIRAFLFFGRIKANGFDYVLRHTGNLALGLGPACQAMIEDGKILDEHYARYKLWSESNLSYQGPWKEPLWIKQYLSFASDAQEFIARYKLWTESNLPYQETLIKQYLAASDPQEFIASLRRQAENAINSGFDYDKEEELWLAYLGLKMNAINISYGEFKERMERLVKFDRKHPGYFKKLFTKIAGGPRIIELSSQGGRLMDTSDVNPQVFRQNLEELLEIRQRVDGLGWMNEDFPQSKVFNLRNLYYSFKRQEAQAGGLLKEGERFRVEFPAERIMKQELLSNRKTFYKIVFSLAKERMGDVLIGEKCLLLMRDLIISDIMLDDGLLEEMRSTDLERQISAFKNFYEDYKNHLPDSLGLTVRKIKGLERAFEDFSSRVYAEISKVRIVKQAAAVEPYRLIEQGFLSVFRGRAGIIDCSFDIDGKGDAYARAMHEDARYLFVYKGRELKGYIGLMIAQDKDGRKVLAIDTINSPSLDGEELLINLFKALNDFAAELGCIGIALPKDIGPSFNFDNEETILEMAVYKKARSIKLGPLHQESWDYFTRMFGKDAYNSIEKGKFVLLNLGRSNSSSSLASSSSAVAELFRQVNMLLSNGKIESARIMIKKAVEQRLFKFNDFLLRKELFLQIVDDVSELLLDTSLIEFIADNPWFFEKYIDEDLLSDYEHAVEQGKADGFVGPKEFIKSYFAFAFLIEKEIVDNIDPQELLKHLKFYNLIFGPLAGDGRISREIQPSKIVRRGERAEENDFEIIDYFQYARNWREEEAKERGEDFLVVRYQNKIMIFYRSLSHDRWRRLEGMSRGYIFKNVAENAANLNPQLSVQLDNWVKANIAGQIEMMSKREDLESRIGKYGLFFEEENLKRLILSEELAVRYDAMWGLRRFVDPFGSGNRGPDYYAFAKAWLTPRIHLLKEDAAGREKGNIGEEAGAAGRFTKEEELRLYIEKGIVVETEEEYALNLNWPAEVPTEKMVRLGPSQVLFLARKIAAPRLSLDEVKNFDMLYAFLRSVGEIKGSNRFYTADEIVNIIERVRKGELPPERITNAVGNPRAEGLRDKVEELLKQEGNASSPMASSPAMASSSVITLEDISRFKADLQRLSPEIKEDLEKIPDEVLAHFVQITRENQVTFGEDNTLSRVIGGVRMPMPAKSTIEYETSPFEGGFLTGIRRATVYLNNQYPRYEVWSYRRRKLNLILHELLEIEVVRRLIAEKRRMQSQELTILINSAFTELVTTKQELGYIPYFNYPKELQDKSQQQTTTVGLVSLASRSQIMNILRDTSFEKEYQEDARILGSFKVNFKDPADFRRQSPRIAKKFFRERPVPQPPVYKIQPAERQEIDPLVQKLIKPLREILPRTASYLVGEAEVKEWLEMVNREPKSLKNILIRFTENPQFSKAAVFSWNPQEKAEALLAVFIKEGVVSRDKLSDAGSSPLQYVSGDLKEKIRTAIGRLSAGGGLASINGDVLTAQLIAQELKMNSKEERLFINLFLLAASEESLNAYKEYIQKHSPLQKRNLEFEELAGFLGGPKTELNLKQKERENIEGVISGLRKLKVGLSSSPAQLEQNQGNLAALPAVTPENKVGGIDFRALPILTQVTPVSPLSPAPSTPALPAGRQRPAPNINLEAEWSQIQNMLNAGIIPSADRIKDYLSGSLQKQKKDLPQEREKALGLIADVLRIEERDVSSTQPALRELLVWLQGADTAH